MDATWWPLAGFGAVLVASLAWLARPSGHIESNATTSAFGRAWRRLASWAGDVRWISHFPFLTWDKREKDISYATYLPVLKTLQLGDVMLSKSDGYLLSNTAIPGCFKHAALVTHGPVCSNDGTLCDITDMKVTEAVSEGVLEHTPLDVLTDKMIFLRPKGMTPVDLAHCIEKARIMVGLNYDTSFDFNIEDELERLEASFPNLRGADPQDVQQFARNIEAEFDMAFSCTELVAACWWHKRQALRLYRQKRLGRQVIIADQFVNNGFEIIWTNVTPAEAKKRGMPEEGVQMLEAWWKGR